mmetsp:Transcript_25351/g.56351  ORF Transcript_25351/g.56351 Transcript_25351/m.56351 type:complete len:130 (-) Transcript_25351:1192-1581(-)
MSKTSSKKRAKQSLSPSPSALMTDETATILANAAPALSRLTIADVGTADDHGLTGDCPFCLDPLPPFWKEDIRDTEMDTPTKRAGKQSPGLAGIEISRMHLCCGKFSCGNCFRVIRDRAVQTARANPRP